MKLTNYAAFALSAALTAPGWAGSVQSLVAGCTALDKLPAPPDGFAVTPEREIFAGPLAAWASDVADYEFAANEIAACVKCLSFYMSEQQKKFGAGKATLELIRAFNLAAK